VAIPNGAVHAFHNVLGAESVMLVLNWPGRQHEAFISTLGRPVAPGAMPVAGGPPPAEAMAEIRRLSAECGVTLEI
jgi:hypothetical protein